MSSKSGKKMTPLKLSLLAGSSILALGAISIIPKLYQQKAQPLTVAQITTSGTVNLSLSPATVTLSPNGTTDLTLNISNDGTSKATGVSAELTYDATALQVVSVTQGSFFANSLEAATFSGGKITFTYVVPPSSGGKSGSGPVATIRVKALKSGTTTVGFGAGSVASSIDMTGNSLKSNSGSTISVRGRSDIAPSGGDGTVNLIDYNLFSTQFGDSGAVGTIASDIDGNGTVNLFDYNLLASDYGNNY